MAKRPDLTDFTSLVNQTSVVNGLNNNNDEIKDAFDNTLSRDGSTPNAMEADLDMNGNQILNLPTPVDPTDVVTKQFADNNYGGAAATRAENAAAASEGFRDEAQSFAASANSDANRADNAADRAENAPERFIGTSTTSNTIGVGSRTFTTQEDLFFNPGGFVLIVDSAAPTTNYMHGNIVDYSGTSLQVNVTNIGGSGTHANWVIAISGTRGSQGPTGPAGSGAGDLVASNNLSDLDDIPTAVSNLGLTIGTNVQAYDALLQAISALTTSAGQLIKATGVDTVSTISITTAGENLLDDADTAAQRTTLGLGDLAVEDEVTASLVDSGAATNGQALLADGTGGASWGDVSGGVIVDRAYVQTTALVTCSTTMPQDDTIPQITEGTQVLSTTFAMKSTTNRLRVTVSIPVAAGAAMLVGIALYNGASDAIAAAAGDCRQNQTSSTVVLVHEFVPGTTSSVTYSVRAGGTGTMYVNGRGAARTFGGVSMASMVLEEIKV